MEHVAKDDDLVEQDHLSEVRRGLLRLLLRDRVEELLLSFAQLEREQVAWPLNEVVQLVLSLILNNDAVVQVEVVIEAEHVHCLVVDLVRPITLVVILFIVVALHLPVLVRHLLLDIETTINFLLLALTICVGAERLALIQVKILHVVQILGSSRLRLLLTVLILRSATNGHTVRSYDGTDLARSCAAGTSCSWLVGLANDLLARRGHEEYLLFVTIIKYVVGARSKPEVRRVQLEVMVRLLCARNLPWRTFGSQRLRLENCISDE